MSDAAFSQRFKPVQLGGVASGFGAPDAGCEAGADALRASHLSARLRTRGSVVRFAPPLVITRDEIDTALEAIRAAFDEVAAGRDVSYSDA